MAKNYIESKQLFASVLYNLLTPTVYTYPQPFLKAVQNFLDEAQLPEPWDELVRKMLAQAMRTSRRSEDHLDFETTFEKLHTLNSTIEAGLSKIESIKTHKENR